MKGSVQRIEEGLFSRLISDLPLPDEPGDILAWFHMEKNVRGQSIITPLDVRCYRRLLAPSQG